MYIAGQIKSRSRPTRVSELIAGNFTKTCDSEHPPLSFQQDVWPASDSPLRYNEVLPKGEEQWETPKQSG